MLKALMKPFDRWMASQSPTIQVESTPFTPDLWKLDTYFFQNVFVYNQFMRGCEQYKHVMDGHVVKQFSAFTHDDNYVMWMKDLGLESQAFALPIGPEQVHGSTSLFGLPAKVLGQVYTMRPNQIVKLDEVMQNGVMYTRQRIKVDVPYARRNGKTIMDVEVKTIPCWAYIGRLDYWAEQLNPTDKRHHPVKMYNTKQDREPYYFYSEKNEQNFRK